MKKLFILIALVATVIPSVFVIYKAGGPQAWQGVLPRGTTDSLYYYTRMKEVKDGHLLIGNPYAYEYRNTYSPAFFIPDIISAVPLILGIPFDISIAFNMFIWSFVFLILAFRLFEQLKFERKWAFVQSVVLYITAYSFILRPTIMQLIYPLFLTFLIVFIEFLKEPTARKKIIWLSFVSAMTFYAYTYLSYIVFLSLVLVFFWFLATKRYLELRALFKVAVYSGLMLIPFGIYTIFQIGSPYYLETLSRIGLIYTHIPSVEVFYYGRWIVVALATLIVLRKYSLFWFATGVALLIGLGLNVITGVELQLAVHIGRFVILWMFMIFGFLIYEWYSARLSLSKLRLIAATTLIIIMFIGVGRNVVRGVGFFKFDNRDTDKVAFVQSYAQPLKWLDENVKEESVIFANQSISEYVSIMTKHYPFFFHGAQLHNIPSEELEMKRLLSLNPGSLTIEDLNNLRLDYFVVDSTKDSELLPKFMRGVKPEYDDGRFNIYKLPK